MILSERASLRYEDHGREVFACRDLDLQIESKEFVGILGPSGSGKSSLLYLLSGLKTPTSGRITYDGQCLAAMPEVERSRLRLREFGFVFQQPFLLGYLSALENVVLASPPKGRAVAAGPAPMNRGFVPAQAEFSQRSQGSAADAEGVSGRSVAANSPEERARELLEVLGLGGKAHRLPHELSVGERQRVCVARALLGDPKVIFADEPTAALDHKTGEQVVALLNEHRGEGSLVMVTHDESMLSAADRVLRIVEGRLVDP
ncbi:MAG: ATP-binding cassette domain-containing protein [Armatimonadetes bacterium]|nr:ATP-binding cassette domain-containing protein [Armatimonadota bacterium]